MIVRFYQPAAEHEQYMPHAFDKIIGQEALFRIAGVARGWVTIIAVEVDEDGRGATWTVDIPGGDPAKTAETQETRWSFRSDPEPSA